MADSEKENIMRREFKNTATLIPVLILAGTLSLTSCAPQKEDIASSPPSAVSTINGVNFTKGLRLLYNAETRFEYPKAIEHLQTASKSNPESAEIKFHLAYAYLKRSKYAETKALLESLENNDATLTNSQKLWSQAMRAKVEDQTTAEIKAWQSVLENDASDRWAWYELSSVQSTAELYADAAISAEKALEVEPDSSKWEASWIYYLLSKAYYRSGQYEAGVASAQKGKNNQTTWRSTYFRQSLAKLRSGQVTDHERIVKDYIDVSNTEGRNNISYTYANVALFYHELGDLDNAEMYARKAHQEDPKGYQSWALGFVLADTGKADEALELLFAAAREFPENNYVHAAKGWAEYRLGRLEDAQQSFDKAREHTKRRNYSLEGMADIIAKAAENPKLPRAPQIPWLG